MPYAEVSDASWPSFVQFVCGDGAEEIANRGTFDLIFADDPSSKLVDIEGTISALSPNGLLVVDDMDLAQHADDPQLVEQLAKLTEKLLDDARLLCVECPFSSGVILATRRQ